MNRQQFTRWLARLLDVLPWRRARRPARSQAQAHILSRPTADRFASPDPQATLRQKAETAPPCSTLPEDPSPARPEVAESLPPSRLALPASPTVSTNAPPTQESTAPVPVSVDPERRLAFGRFLVKRGVFNEGFPSGAVPAQYRQSTPE